MPQYTIDAEKALALFSSPDGETWGQDILTRSNLDKESSDLATLFDTAWSHGVIGGHDHQPVIETARDDAAGADWTITTAVGTYPAQVRIAAFFDWKALPSEVTEAALAAAAVATVVEHLNIELRALDAYATSPAEARLRIDLPEYTANGMPGHIFHFGVPRDTRDEHWERLLAAVAASPGVADVTRRGDRFEVWGEPLPDDKPYALEHVAVRLVTDDGRPLRLAIARLVADVARQAAQRAVSGLVDWSNEHVCLTDGIYEYDVDTPAGKLRDEELDVLAAYTR